MKINLRSGDVFFSENSWLFNWIIKLYQKQSSTDGKAEYGEECIIDELVFNWAFISLIFPETGEWIFSCFPFWISERKGSPFLTISPGFLIFTLVIRPSTCCRKSAIPILT